MYAYNYVYAFRTNNLSDKKQYSIIRELFRLKMLRWQCTVNFIFLKFYDIIIFVCV